MGMGRRLQGLLHRAGIVRQYAEIADAAAQPLQEVAQHPAIGVPDLAGLQQDPGIADLIARREQPDGSRWNTGSEV
jgi:hypothetical protein